LSKDIVDVLGAACQASSPPYDIAVSLDTSRVYVSTANPPSIWKFRIINTGLLFLYYIMTLRITKRLCLWIRNY